MNEGVVLGDSLAVETQEFTPQLTGIGEEKVVKVYNPLPHPFRVSFSRQQAFRPTPDPNRQFAREKGLPLDKSDPKAYVAQDIVLPAQGEMNLPGDIAQIAVRKLVNTIIQTRLDDGSYDFERGGPKKGLLSDPALRQETEKEIVRGVYDATTFFNQAPSIPQPQAIQNEIEALNEPANEAVTDPAPGTGVHYTPEEAVPSGTGQPDTAESRPANPAKASAKAK